MKTSPILSFAGTWIPIDAGNLIPGANNGGLASTTYAHVAVNGGNGLIVSGWGWTGAFGTAAAAAVPEQVHVAVLAPQADGTLQLATATYLDSDLINGANAVAVADFNGDGRSDVFLPAHNESPFLAEASTLYLANAAGGFDKLTLDDKVMAHDAELASINGVPTVLTATFNPGDANPVYTWANGQLVQAIPSQMSSIFHQSVVEGSFGPNGGMAVAMGDVFSHDAAINGKISVYGFDGRDVVSSTPTFTVTPYLSAKYPDFTSIYGTGVTHTYRILADDFNHDGLTDLMAEESMFNSQNNYPTVLQLLQNTGNGQFADKTDALGGAVSQAISELDYQPQVLDLDHSGIGSILLAGGGAGNLVDGKVVYDNDRAPNYLLLNDGTGKLYAALHEQFKDLGNQVIQYLQPMAQNADGSTNFYIGSDIGSAGEPKFVGYQAADGSLDFEAEVNVGYWSKPGTWATKYLFVNVPLHYDATHDYTSDVLVADRNHSTLMRTWAGNDVFSDANANAAPAHIDGGLGFDVARYGGRFDQYQLSRQADGSVTVASSGPGPVAVHDTLVNIEQLQFADVAVSLDLAGSDAQAYRIYQAAFDRKPDLDGLGYWIAQMRAGASVTSVATGFIQSAEFTKLYGSAPTADAFVTRLYENVLHRAPEQAGFDYWTEVLHADDGLATKAAVLAAFSESPENQAQLVGAIHDGIVFTPWQG